VSEGQSRDVLIAPQEHGWAVITRYHGGKWDGFETTHYCRWIWQARAEQRRIMRQTAR
jgi:hypothetical protein